MVGRAEIVRVDVRVRKIEGVRKRMVMVGGLKVGIIKIVVGEKRGRPAGTILIDFDLMKCVKEERRKRGGMGLLKVILYLDWCLKLEPRALETCTSALAPRSQTSGQDEKAESRIEF